MKILPMSAIVLVLSASSAFAASKSETVVLNDAVVIGSTHLPAGNCKVSWTGEGNDVQVTFLEKNAAPVTVPATLLQEKHSHSGVSTETRDGSKALLSVELQNVKLVLKNSTVAAN